MCPGPLRNVAFVLMRRNNVARENCAGSTEKGPIPPPAPELTADRIPNSLARSRGCDPCVGASALRRR